MNQRKKDQKNKARRIASRKKVLARREEIRKQRKEEERLEKEFEAKELKNLSNDEIKQRIQQNFNILEGLYQEILKKEQNQISSDEKVENKNFESPKE